MVRYPDVKVKLVGEDGNAFSIIGRVVSALREAAVPAAEIREFRDQATSGDYAHLLCTVMDWVEEPDDEEEEDDDWEYEEDEEEEDEEDEESY